ncbi:MAG: glycine zipper 2TM domain-containing protein [Rhodobacteraceae bacterium]|nr:glycine zipper 2TM domain-containing protein [Paracoccaceae bacterium]
MKARFLLLPTTLLFFAACQPMNQGTDQTTQNAVLGAAAGAALGAAVSGGNDRVKGALIGGTVGAVAATLIGRSSTPGQCIYRDAYGRKIMAPC